MKTLFGLTIGPIFETMSHAKKTRELWFGSFFFSWYIKKLCDQLGDFELLTPVSSGELKPSKAGLFPDHVIGTSQLGQSETIDRLKKITKDIKDEFVTIIDSLGKKAYLNGKSIRDVNNILNDYLEVGFIVRDAAGVDELEIIKTMDILLDALERERSFLLGKNENTCNRCTSLPSTFEIYEDDVKKRLCPFCFFKYKSNAAPEVCNEIGENIGFRYRSTGEISAHGLIEQIKPDKLHEYLDDADEIDFDSEDFKAVLGTDNPIKSYHKYMAIVQADGDNLGKIAAKIKEPTLLSEKLFKFGVRATEITQKEYHGEPVYLGGDDLLAFMPTAFALKDGEEVRTVIDYVNELSKAYREILNDPEIEVSTTLSFGIHIFYYKSPLSLALESAREQLARAKRLGKDAIALQFTKHSGQQSALIFKNGSDELRIVNELLYGIVKGNISYPQGIHHNLQRFETVLTNLTDSQQLTHFMENRFNEEIHAGYTAIGSVFNLLKQMLTDHANGSPKLLRGKPAKEKFNEFLSQLRLIKFLVGDAS